MNNLPETALRIPITIVTSRERRWVLLFACLVMVLTTLPYFQGYAVEGEAYRFNGFVFGVQDGNSYIAKMLNGAYGAWLFRTPYTVLPQRGVLMYLPYILLGKLAAPPGLHVQLVMLFHLFRFIAGVLMILASYDFLAFFVRNIHLRRVGILLISLGSGLGWLLILYGQGNLLGSLPLEFYSPESFGFLSLFGLPHLALARACMLWMILIYLRRLTIDPARIQKEQSALQAGLLWLLAGLGQPLTLFVIGVVLLIHLAGLAVWQVILQVKGRDITWGRWSRLLRFVVLAGFLPSLLLLYYTISTLNDPFLTAWSTQNILPSPHPMHYLFAYGLLLPFVWLGGKQIIRKNPWEGWLLVGWALIFPFLAYFPTSIQRRLPDGVWVVFCVLSLLALQEWSDKSLFTKAKPRALLIFYLLLFLPSTLMLWWGGMEATRQAKIPLFRPLDEVELFDVLQTQAQPDQVILASFETGNALPAWAPVRVVVGHGPESAHLEVFFPEVKRFYQADTPEAQRWQWMAEWGISYVIWGPSEREMGDWNPSSSDQLQLLQQSGEYHLFGALP